MLSGGHQTELALTIAGLCYDTLLAYGPDARLAVQNGVISDAVEKVIEANILPSGMGFESGGLAAVHSVHNGLTIREETHQFYHGEKVSFGVITQLVLKDRAPVQILEVLDLCLEVGLPVCLEDLHLAGLSREEAREIGEAACAAPESIHNSPFAVTPDMVAEAILTADVLGKARNNKIG